MRELTTNEQSELNDVAWHWDTAYQVSFNGEVYVASRLGSPEQLVTGETPTELREQIRRDYAAWQATWRESASL